MSLDKLVILIKKPPFWCISLVVIVSIYHWSVWALTHLTQELPWSDLLRHWDSGWYSNIIQNGYSGRNFAFYPLFPSIVSGMSQILPKNFTPEIIGATTSTALFLLYGVLVAFLLAKTPTNLTWGFLPTSPLAWFFMVWSPASYIFQSHHTEAIFLILSFFAFLACASQRFLTASIISGLCALTKNQGIFVAVSVGFWWALEGTFWRIKLRNFLLSGFISGIIFSIFPIYSFCKTGDFTAFYSAQSHWRPEMTAFSYVKALWFGNSWQNTNIGSIERYVLFWTLIFSVFSIWRKNRPLAFYVALFVGVMPLSGEFVGTFRYSSVLWPAWFCFAEQLASLSLRLRRFAIPFVVLLFLYINHQLTMNYGLERWSY